MKTGTAHLPLHGGKAPFWLFSRMKRLAREVVLAILYDADPQELLKRLSDPFWFQALGCILGFDWHSSGVTTTVCGALKEGIRGMEHEIGFFIAGGKGRISRQTPDEICRQEKYLTVDPENLVYKSRMSAKVDSAAVQDGYQLYHHAFFFTREGRWAVVQQGMNDQTRYARRYHWLGLEPVCFSREPHQAICCDCRGRTLNLVALEGEGNRLRSASLASEEPSRLLREFRKLDALELPARHGILESDIQSGHLHRIFLRTYECRPADYEALLAIKGVGPKTLRALSLLAELLYGEKPSFRDPARYSYAHGGKDGHPYPVDRETYDRTIDILKNVVNASRMEVSDKRRAFRRLAVFSGARPPEV